MILAPTTPDGRLCAGRTVGQSDCDVPERCVRGARVTGRTARDVGACCGDRRWPAAGLQIIGKALDEQSVFNAGLAIEERAGFVAKPEQWW